MHRLIATLQIILGLALILFLGVFRPGNPALPALTALGAGFAMLGSAMAFVAPGVWLQSRRAAIASLSFLSAAAILALSFRELLEYAAAVHRAGFPADGLPPVLLLIVLILSSLDAVLLVAYLSSRRREMRSGSERWRYAILWAAVAALPPAVAYRELVLDVASLERRVARLPPREVRRPMDLGIPVGSAIDPLQANPDLRRYLDLARDCGAARVGLHVSGSILAGEGDAGKASLEALRSAFQEANGRGLHPVLLDRPARMPGGGVDPEWRSLRETRLRAAGLVAGALRPEVYFVLREPGRLIGLDGTLPGGSDPGEMAAHARELAAAVRAAAPGCRIGIALDPGNAADWRCYFDLRRSPEIDLIGLDVIPANLSLARRLLEDASLCGKEVWITAAGSAVCPAWHQPWRERGDALWLQLAVETFREAGASAFFVAHPDQLWSYRPGSEDASRRTDSYRVIETLFW